MASNAPTEGPELTGFAPDTAEFLSGLAADNTKAYFEANRAAYTAFVRQPLEAFLAAAEPIYGAGKVMRPHRDVRFSKNKDPYRTDASMMAGSVGAVYLNVNPDRIEVGGGLYDPARDQLDRARASIAEQPVVASKLQAALAELEASGFELAGAPLKTAPRGYDPTHPAIALLRLQHYAALRTLPLDSPPSEVLETWSRLVPLIEWIDEHVGASRIARH
ncbi:uncharacterized protein (TIGR02453 family) [Salinibacterium sp. CAN_S4]|uniref:DUF2461 domain-containing protein n=1 Tax=Salinibacterium sp. CAN_S4 TaxID=2787727 RepID=UPI0018F02AE9